MKRTQRLLGLLACALLLGVAAVAPASASATIKWTQGDEAHMRWEITSLGVKREGGKEVTCTPTTAGGLAVNTEGEASGFAENWLGYRIRMSCAGSSPTLEWDGYIEPTSLISAGKYSVSLGATGEELASPLAVGGIWWQDVEATDGVWTNGSGSTPSTLTFTNSHVGTQVTGGFSPLLMSATIKVKTTSGGLLTLTGS